MSEEFNVVKKIKNLRKEKKMNGKELAIEADISYDMISLLESGSTQGSVDTLIYKVMLNLYYYILKLKELLKI